MHIAIQVIGQVLGIDWKIDDSDPVAPMSSPTNASVPTPAQPRRTIAEVAAAAPLPGADLTQASADILRQMGIG